MMKGHSQVDQHKDEKPEHEEAASGKDSAGPREEQKPVRSNPLARRPRLVLTVTK